MKTVFFIPEVEGSSMAIILEELKDRVQQENSGDWGITAMVQGVFGGEHGMIVNFEPQK